MSLPDVPNYILYRLAWDAEKQKYRKKPCRLDGNNLTEGETPPMTTRAAAVAALASLPAPSQHSHGYALGFWFTVDLNLFFLDLDSCVSEGQLTADAARIAVPFINAGCYFEGSSSGRGAHIVGSYTGNLPAHSNVRPSVHTYEFYTRDRGMVVNTECNQGSAFVDCTAQVVTMLAELFPPRVAINMLKPVGQRRAEWRGPEDDEELIRRMLSARGSVAAALGARTSFRDLWQGKVEQNNQADMALASHLAFWTGCDVERMDRLMRRSGLKREKWDERRRDTTYLGYTIFNACATTENVYQEPVREDTATALVGAPGSEWNTVVNDVIARINNSGTYEELMDNVVPTIGPMGIPPIRAERIITALRSRLELFNSKPPVSMLRQLVCPPNAKNQTSLATSAPDWIGVFCYVKSTDKFFNTLTCEEYSSESFRAEYSRFMPLKSNGTREDPVTWARDHWNIVTVSEATYRPGQPVFFEYAGRQFVNRYREDSMPQITEPSKHALSCIEAFKQHLWLMTSHREHLYQQLLMWLAYNVQNPGRKIRWSPLIKGVGGDGKSIFGELMFCAMGERNVKITSVSNISNSGGFTDWSTGKCVNVIEEIRLEGRERRKIYNAMKIFIGDTRIDLNRKGKAAGDTLINYTNHWLNTNYGDAMPLDPDDRRVCVVFSPYSTAMEAAAAKGLPDVSALVQHFKLLGASMNSEPGAWRGWLMSIDTSSFDPDGRAPNTPEKDSMKLMSSDSLDQTVVDVIEHGGRGVGIDVFSSSRLAGLVQLKTGERPDARGWNSLLTRLGYRQMEKTVWWDGTSHRIWAKKLMTNEQIREKLDQTLTAPNSIGKNS